MSVDAFLPLAIVGGVAGFLAGRNVPRALPGGIAGSTAIGIIGGVAGGWLLSAIGLPAGIAGRAVWQLFLAFIGAIALLTIVNVGGSGRR